MRSDVARALLIDHGAAGIEHPGGRLLDHLERTEHILRLWDATEDVCLAGLCHAAFGTARFPTALFEVAERDELRAVIGTEAESHVYLYGASDWTRDTLRFTTSGAVMSDRFSGSDRVVDAGDLQAFALISIANELDVWRTGALDEDATTSIVDLFERLEVVTPREAWLAQQEVESA